MQTSPSGRHLVAIILLVFVCIPYTLGRSLRPLSTTHRQEHSAHFRNTAPGVGYVGSKVCSRCHAEIYREYMRTAMGRSMTQPGESSLPELVTAPIKIHIDKFDRDYEVFRRGSAFYQSEFEAAPDGSDIFRDTRQIAYVIGVGQNGIGYLVQDGNYLLEAPLSYWTQLHSFALSPGYEAADYGFDRVVRDTCIICHSGRPQTVAGRPGLYQDLPFKELAIGCENCHGPGQLHVSERTSDEPLRGAIDSSIVNPRRLAGWLADNICMVCHQGGDTRILRSGKSFRDFRPGTPLDNTVAIFAVPFTRHSPPQAPMLQQYVEMVLSKCYRGSGGRMTCITCHDPHFELTAAQAPAYFRRKCLSCHTERSCRLTLAVRRRRSPPDDCAGCHMPQQNFRRIPHATLTNHRIIADAGEPFPAEAFHMTTALVPDLVHLDAVPGKENASVTPIILFQAYGELLETHPEYEASYDKLLDQLAKTQPQDPLILSALARRAVRSGNPEGFATAQSLLAQAIARGSTTASDYNLYARLLIHFGSWKEAVSILQRGRALNPYSTQWYKMLAFVYTQLHDYHRALDVMKQELQVFPQDSSVRSLVTRLESLVPPSK